MNVFTELCLKDALADRNLPQHVRYKAYALEASFICWASPIIPQAAP